jgi:hypothetical protein
MQKPEDTQEHKQEDAEGQVWEWQQQWQWQQVWQHWQHW